MVDTQDFLDAIDADMAASASNTDTPATNNANHNSVAPIKFSGRHDLFKLPDFLYTIEAQMYSRELNTDHDRIAFVGRSLTGPAARWFVNWLRTTSTPDDFQVFINDFKTKFTRMIDPHAVLNAFQKLQERNVGIENYNTKFSHLLALMPEGIWTPKGELLFYFRGLQPETARIVALMHPSDVNAAMDAAVETVSITNRALPTTGIVDYEGDIQMAAAMNGLNLNHGTYDSHQVAAFHRGGGRGSNRRGKQRQSDNHSRASRRPSRHECFEKNLCFHCYSPKHRYNDCPVRNASNRK